MWQLKCFQNVLVHLELLVLVNLETAYFADSHGTITTNSSIINVADVFFGGN